MLEKENEQASRESLSQRKLIIKDPSCVNVYQWVMDDIYWIRYIAQELTDL